MKNFCCIVLLFFYSISYNAQTELWGMTANGGQYSSGTLFKTDGSGNNHTVTHQFFQLEGQHPESTNLIEASDGKFYGVTKSGGPNGFGVLFQYDPVTDIYTKKIDFSGATIGKFPLGSLIQASDGMLYGLTKEGGAQDSGVLFQYNPITNICVNKLNFGGTQFGSNPYGSLIQASDGKLYGMTLQGGTNSDGVLFQYDYSTGAFVKKNDFDDITTGGHPTGSLVEAANGKLYGLVGSGGLYGWGTLIEFDPNTNILTKKIDFDVALGGPIGNLMQATDGKLYGITRQGGTYGIGTLFQYDYNVNTVTKKLDFDGPIKGSYPGGSVMQATDGNIYGMTSMGGLNNYGVLFQYDPISGSFAKKLDFDGPINGNFPLGALMQASNGKLYGLTCNGGTSDQGVIFQYDPVTSNTIVKINFSSMTNGGLSYGSLTILGSKLWGLASSGGANNLGVIFQIDPVTNNYSKKFDFTILSGMYPFGSLLLASDGMLYGMTQYGGATSNGTLFQFDPNTNLYTKKIDFAGVSNGSSPKGSLMQATNGKIYGMTYYGGTNFTGVLFEYDPITNTYVKKYDFSSLSDGSNPEGDLIQASDGMLYGMTHQGGANNFGVLFQYDISTNTYTKKIDFAGLSNGSYPTGSLLQATDGMLYGMTPAGGIHDSGAIFQYNPITNICTKKIDFGGSVGAEPYGSLMQATDGNLYGMTAFGGINSNGVLFQYNPSNSNFVKKLDFNGNNGSYSYHTTLIEITSTPTNAKENIIYNSYDFYPNPNDGSFTIDLNSKSHITITNILGETVLNQMLETGKQNLNIQSQTNGIYFAKVIDAKGLTSTKKIVIEK